MRVVFKGIRAGSGADIWANDLSKGLKCLGVDSSTIFFPPTYRIFPSLIRFLKNEDADIVHSNIAYGYAFKSRTPLVVTEFHLAHDTSFSSYTSTAQKLYYKKLYRDEKKSLKVADAVTCISIYTKAQLERAFGYRDSIMIYPGIDENVFKPASVNRDDYGIGTGKTILLYTGNLLKRKGADLLPDIMERLGEDYVLLMTSGLRNDVRYESKNIRALGRLSLPDLVRAYNLCDIVLFPSRLEGFGLTVAEGMACEKPIVATDCSSLPELVVDGKGGFLCRMDDTAEFAEKIRTLAVDGNMRRAMGTFNRKRVLEKFTIERMAKEYIKLYESL